MVNFSGLTNWFSKNPNASAALLGGGLTLAGGALQGQAQDKLSQREQQTARERLAFDKLRAAGDLVGNPLQDQARRNQMAMLRQLLLGNLNVGVTPPAHLAGVTGTVQGPRLTDAQMPFLQPDAMAAAEAPKWNLVNQMAPGTMTPSGLGAMGYGDAANQAAIGNAVAGTAGALSPQDEFNSRFQEIAAAKQQTGDWEKAYQQVTGKAWPKGQHIKIDPSGQSGTMEKDASAWKKVGKIAATVAPIAAAPFTGGTSLALIGAGAGAAKGLLDGGGIKGALMGGGMGALGGALNGAAGKTPFSWGALGKQLASPQGIAAGVSAGVGGPVGQIAGMAAPFLPGAQFNTPGQSLAPGATAANGYNNQTSVFPAPGAPAANPAQTLVDQFASTTLPRGPISNLGNTPTMPPPVAVPKSVGRGVKAKAVDNAVGGGKVPLPPAAGPNTRPIPSPLLTPNLSARGVTDPASVRVTSGVPGAPPGRRIAINAQGRPFVVNPGWEAWHIPAWLQGTPGASNKVKY